MKKSVLVLVLAMVTSLSFGQWTQKYYVDEFGDPTEKGYNLLIGYGTFSNSATQDSDLRCDFVLAETSLVIEVYEYGNNLANDIEATFETVKIKTPTRGVITIEDVFFSKKGVLYFSEERFKDVKEAISEEGTYIMVFKRKSDYSESSYKVKFTL